MNLSLLILSSSRNSLGKKDQLTSIVNNINFKIALRLGRHHVACVQSPPPLSKNRRRGPFIETIL